MTRHVLLIGPWAFKVPRVCRWKGENQHEVGCRWRLFVAGVLHNLNEWRDRARPDVAPALWTLGGFVNCARRAKPVDLALLELHIAALARDGRRDLRPANLGLLDGHLVLVDYA